MKAFLQIIKLELVASVRSRMVHLLSFAVVAWMILLPYIITGDGTVDGAYQIFIRYGLGFAFALSAVCLSTAAASSIAKDRDSKRLQLSLVRPVRISLFALGRTIALSIVGAGVLLLASICALIFSDMMRPAYHMLSPQMESPREEAERMYESYIADPETPMEVRKAKKDVVIRLLTQKAFDHYQTIQTNEFAIWNFSSVPANVKDISIRLRFTNLFESRDTVSGFFALPSYYCVVSNQTQAVLTLPFVKGEASGFGEIKEGELKFRNDGLNSLMLRPRRDIHLLYTTSLSFFGVNLLCALVEMISLLTVIIAFAMFLSSSLGRSVAIFTLLVMLFLSAVSASVIEQYPDSLESDKKDRLGLMMTRFVTKVASPLSSFTPISSLSEDEFIEVSNAFKALLLDALFLPLFLSVLSGVIMRRKSPGDSYGG